MSGGANCPETPRQKMIGMMYLFLTAMLALNISKEILNAFVVVNDGLEATNNNFKDKNESAMSEVMFAYMQDKVKAQPAMDAANKVKKSSEELVIYIDKLKKEIINLTELGGHENIDAMYGDTVKLINVAAKDANAPSTHYFMGGSSTTGEKGIDGNAGKAPEFRAKLQDYVKDLKEVMRGLNIKNVDKMGDLGVNTSDPEHKSADHPEENFWASSNFYHLPLAAEVAILSQFENQIRNAEATVMAQILTSIGKTDMKFDKLEARVVPRSTYVIQGTDYEADLFVAAWSSTSKPKIIVGPANQLDTSDSTDIKFKPGADTTVINVVDGVGKYKVKANTIGDRKYASIIEVKNTSTGITTSYPLKVGDNYYTEYKVAKPTAVISPTKMNVFYIGVDNPVSISVPGYAAESISARIQGSGSIRAKNKSKGEWIAKVRKRGKPIKVVVTATDEFGNKKTFPGQKFRVKAVPDPIAKVSGKSGGSIAKSKLKMASGVKAELENFDFNLPAKVTSFTVSALIGGYEQSKASKSNAFTPAQKALISKVRKKQRITIEKISCKVAGKARKLRDISLKLK